MADEQVRLSRPGEDARVLLMSGRTRAYSVEPRGEYVFGVVAGRPMRSVRARERRLVRPGQLVAWDPSGAHAGRGVDGQPWSSRLAIVEGAGLAAIAGDDESVLAADVRFPEPVITDPGLAHAFVALHRALEAPTTSRLERDARLGEWLRALLRRTSIASPSSRALSARDDRALRLACDYLGDHLARNVSLDELAAAAGIGKFRLVRLFRERTGLPPHALQLAERIRRARRLIEQGEPIAQVAADTGFVDQSHLHRHFRRTLGLTPAAYQRRFRPQSADLTAAASSAAAAGAAASGRFA
jgi:AraC-like DNA-binding protein